MLLNRHSCFSIILFIHLFIYSCAALGLHFHEVFSILGLSQGYSLVTVGQLPIEVSSYCRSWALRHRSFTSCSSWAQKLQIQVSRTQNQQCGTRYELLHGMWDLPGPGIEPKSTSLAGIFFTTELPGKPSSSLLFSFKFLCLSKIKQVY